MTVGTTVIVAVMWTVGTTIIRTVLKELLWDLDHCAAVVPLALLPFLALDQAARRCHLDPKPLSDGVIGQG
jgi:hypothetical protein